MKRHVSMQGRGDGLAVLTRCPGLSAECAKR